MHIDQRMTEKFFLQAKVEEKDVGLRLDQTAARLFPDFSRARLQQWIREGALLVDGRSARPSLKLTGLEVLSLTASEEVREHWEAEDLPLTIVHEDEALLVVNKPAGLVVHPAAGNRDGTLLNALLHYQPSLNTVPRAGIVHRLDKDTSGLLVIAKTASAHHALVKQLQKRTVKRQYEAVVHGLVTAGGTVDAPLGRHPKLRTKRAVVTGESGKPAVTHYLVSARYRAHTRLLVRLETGRTHQIRVHMAHAGFPLVGDQVYGGRLKLPKGASAELIDCLREFRRQALHARLLGLNHPLTGDYMEWRAEVPEDIQQLIQVLEQDND